MEDQKILDRQPQVATSAVVLRACPFCNRPANIVGEYGSTQWKCGCELCGYWLKPWRQKGDAAQVWNMRPEADERIAEAQNDEMRDGERKTTANTTDHL